MASVDTYFITLGIQKNINFEKLLSHGLWACVVKDSMENVTLRPLSNAPTLPFATTDRVRVMHTDTTTVTKRLREDGQIFHISVEGNDNVFFVMRNEGGAAENRTAFESWCQRKKESFY